MSSFMDLMTRATERGLVPDYLSRGGIKSLLTQRLDSLPLADVAGHSEYVGNFLAEMAASPVAVCTREANEQHYELPPEYFNLVLGARRKYSSCYWDENTGSLEQAEENALRITCERAAIVDGQQVLELGCGWGSLSLWMAEHYPAARITAVSNSASQRQWIEKLAAQRGLTNLKVVTADMNEFATGERFDRVVSVEMFEHMRNWRELFGRVAGWLKPGGQFFMHVFCHRSTPYFFEVGEENDWMSRYFFSGGMMPSAELPLFFQHHLALENRWLWNGEHYGKTLAAWLQRHDRERETILALFRDVYGDDAFVWYIRWRLFYLACEELFRFRQGNEWFVAHYLFRRREP